MKKILYCLLAVLFTGTGFAFGKESPDTKSIESLKVWLSSPQKGSIGKQKFANANISKEEATSASALIYQYIQQEIKKQWEPEWLEKKITSGNYVMPFDYKIFGEEPADGRSLYISMHGGGKSPAAVNDRQWKNQIGLYTPKEGVYLAPRSAVNDWNMWFQPHVDSLFDKIIRTAIVELNVNPNKVYVMGYSAGGDGAYRMAPRMADRWAAASMMAGHPGDVSPVNLRNTPFMIWMGEKDRAYDRNLLAPKFGQWLDGLQQEDPKGYIHETHIVEGKGHWMDHADTLAVPWMAQYVRNPYPLKVVWRQDNAPHETFYWLSVRIEEAKKENTVIVERSNNTFTILQNDYHTLTIGVNDTMIDFSKPVKIIVNGKVIFNKKLTRKIKTIFDSLEKRKDPSLVFSAYLTVLDNEKVSL
ncbi:MAG: alpha/beta hydrolase [Tannerella sp.]|jgi:pimeloyl-ACP methyl ester carboxylesterase|nr:alpha/beta hydrolase [Tannerella sp.]